MPVRQQDVSDDYALYNADAMEVLCEMPNQSVDISIYSPPFPELYQYSDDVRDMTNCVNYAEAIEQYQFIVNEVSRLTKPGRLSCVHCTDLKRGQLYQYDFPGDVIRVHEKTDFRFFSRITIWKDAWEFARRTRMLTLMHKTLTQDSTLSRTAPPDHILVFKKIGKNQVPVTHPKGLRNYAGAGPIPAELPRDFAHYKGDPRGNQLSHWIYRQYASPVWLDIRRGRLLPYKEARENDEERHVCPLQLDVIERCLTLWSNPGEIMLSPFMGCGSEVCGAIVLGRKGIGCELKGTYYRQATNNCQQAVLTRDANAATQEGALFGWDGKNEAEPELNQPDIDDGLFDQECEEAEA